MDIEKFLSGLIGGAVTGAVALGSALIHRGRREEQFDRLRSDLTEIEKTVSDKVSYAMFKEEIQDIHSRISRTQKEQAAAIDKLEHKVDRLSDSVNFIHGVVTVLPPKLDELTKEIRGKK